jgi:hypothetical protein
MAERVDTYFWFVAHPAVSAGLPLQGVLQQRVQADVTWLHSCVGGNPG